MFKLKNTDREPFQLERDLAFESCGALRKCEQFGPGEQLEFHRL